MIKVPNFYMVALLVCGLCGCGDTVNPIAGRDSTPSSPAPSTAPTPTPSPAAGTALDRSLAPDSVSKATSLRLSQGSPLYLVDASGASLYFLEDNRGGMRCDEICEGAWPPVLADSAQATAAQGVATSKLGTIPRRDGGVHVTYAQQPLYRYAGDSGAGRTAGHGVKDRWGNWSLITPSGERLSGTPAAQNPRDRPGATASSP